MNVKTKKVKGYYSESLGGFTLTIKTEEGKEKYSLYTGEPEDMIFGRNLVNENPIKRMLELAYNAGKNGEELNIEPNKIVE